MYPCLYTLRKLCGWKSYDRRDSSHHTKFQCICIIFFELFLDDRVDISMMERFAKRGGSRCNHMMDINIEYIYRKNILCQGIFFSELFRKKYEKLSNPLAESSDDRAHADDLGIINRIDDINTVELYCMGRDGKPKVYL